jgi:hypothetical protein
MKTIKLIRKGSKQWIVGIESWEHEQQNHQPRLSNQDHKGQNDQLRSPN